MGRAGFLALEVLSATDDERVSGNYGLSDQVIPRRPVGVEPHGVEPHGVEPHGVDPPSALILRRQVFGGDPSGLMPLCRLGPVPQDAKCTRHLTEKHCS